MDRWRRVWDPFDGARLWAVPKLADGAGRSQPHRQMVRRLQGAPVGGCAGRAQRAGMTANDSGNAVLVSASAVEAKVQRILGFIRDEAEKGEIQITVNVADVVWSRVKHALTSEGYWVWWGGSVDASRSWMVIRWGPCPSCWAIRLLAVAGVCAIVAWLASFAPFVIEHW